MDETVTTVDTPAGTVAVRVGGEGPGVLLVHGIPGSAQVWDSVGRGLVTSGFRVLVPDLLGFGASDRPASLDGLWLDAQAGGLAEVLASLEAGPVIAVGHDYGAPTCVSLAHRNPTLVSGLVLAAGNLFTDTPVPGPLKAVTVPLVGGLAARLLLSAPMLRLILRVGVGRPRVRLDESVYLGDAPQRQAIRTIFTAALRDVASRYRGVEAALAELRQPTAVLWGDRDPFFALDQARRVANAVPNAPLRVETGAGHFLPAERPAAFVEAVRQINEFVHPTPARDAPSSDTGGER